jgi:zinc and cadmium transporter
MSSQVVPLTYYCGLILAASVLGGMIPLWIELTHRGMQFASSFVAGVMLGVGLLDMLPHALIAARGAGPGGPTDKEVAMWVLAGLLTMFLIERFLCFHHHDVDESGDALPHEHGPTCAHDHPHHDITGMGAAVGLTVHSVISGVALAASVAHRHENLPLAGLGTFLVIFLHKPFDSLTIGMLMARGGWSVWWRHAVNGVFALAIPVGVGLFSLGMAASSVATSTGSTSLALALAFSAGTFLCIALSDLLPELQFHDHDRVQLSVALLLGLAVAYIAGEMEGLVHRHTVTTVGACLPTGRDDTCFACCCTQSTNRQSSQRESGSPLGAATNPKCPPPRTTSVSTSLLRGYSSRGPEGTIGSSLAARIDTRWRILSSRGPTWVAA